MKKRMLKRWIDLFMTVCLILLMSYQITGEMLHEWIGIGMLILFLLHNALNAQWYMGLGKGRFQPVRMVWTAVNLSLLAAMLLVMYSGIVLSRYVFSFLPINSGMALARKLHLAGTYWSFVLMSIHLGLHWEMITEPLRRLAGKENSALFPWQLRLAGAMAAGYGAVCFWRADILSYLFLQVEFAFLDYDKSAFMVFAEAAAMMGFWIFISNYGIRGLGAAAERKRRKKKF